MSTGRRLATGGRIDRGAVLRFTFDGVEHTGFAGDTLASALLAQGVHRVATSIKHGRPRGIMAAGVEEPNALVQVEAPFPEPMLTATTVELYDGLVARSLPGRGRLATEPDPARYDTMHAHCEVLVVGAGPAGLAAARAAAQGGDRVLLVDDGSEPGGSLLGTSEHLDGAPAVDWVAATVAELTQRPDVRVLPRTTVVGYYDDNYLLAVERRTDHLGLAAPTEAARQRVWRIRAREVVLATGAHERPVVFADNDRPGTMLAASARTYLNRYGVLPGRRAVAFTTNDSAYAAVLDLAAAGVEVAAVVDARDPAPQPWADRCREAGIEVLAGHAVVGTSGGEHLSAAHVAALSEPDVHRVLDCDLLLVSGGWNPTAQLHAQAHGPLAFDDGLGAFVPDAHRGRTRVVGAARGLTGLARCLHDGAEAGAAAAGVPPEVAVPRCEDAPVMASTQLWVVPGGPSEAPWSTHYVDLQRDATAADVLRATGAGMRSVEHVKRYTTISTSHEQGKTSGVVAAGVVAHALGLQVGDLGTTTSRPPYVPVAFATLAGRNRGVLHDPVRVTPIHAWHLDRGAVFENVGQWKRPEYYPRGGDPLDRESRAEAVRRECAAVREGVGLMDASTLGMIDVQGPDAAELMDRVYTGMMSTLKVGSVRYGVMCSLEGMVFDDGTVSRIGEHRFLMTTTTGNAAPVLAWLEEWLQTEWPDLQVWCTSVTEQWATLVLAGPGSRQLLSEVTPALAVDNDSFPFMTWRDAEVCGVPARVGRVSFSGELAYEVSVAGGDALGLWEALMAAGEAHGITPYGTETMHVLRAEKGYPIIGQDTDGTVTPVDLGLGWAVSKKKPDFIGKRSLSRSDTARTDRKQLVGLLPTDTGLVLPEGAQLIGTADVPAPPVPMLGHVTSSYHSVALGRSFALALVKGGRDRCGDTVYAPLADGVAAVTITSPVLYDPEGARRDG